MRTSARNAESGPHSAAQGFTRKLKRGSWRPHLGLLGHSMLASMSQHAIPERWTELNVARRERRQCADDIEALKKSCASECQKEYISQCPACFEKVVERMWTRYRTGGEREWFTQRRAFLQGLDGQFAEVRRRKRSLKSVESRIESEKEAWYRWMLRRHPDFLAIADNGAHRNKLRGTLDDPDQTREVLVSTVWEGVGQPENWSSRTDEFAANVAAAGNDDSALKALYETEFFTEASTGSVLEHAQKYLDEYRANAAMKLEDAVDLIVKDHEQSRSSQSQRTRNIERLGELQRAKTAFEQNRLRAKGLAPTAAAPAIRDELYNLPLCLVCQGRVNTRDVLSCSVCQATAQMGGNKPLTVYCSKDCFGKGHVSPEEGRAQLRLLTWLLQDGHVEKEHGCVAAERCIHAQGEDVLMEDEQSSSVVCKECLDQSQLTVYCSEACAALHIADHRQSKHGVKTAPEETQSLLVALDEAVESILQKGNPGVIFSEVQ